jgi:hypothetical protein
MKILLALTVCATPVFSQDVIELPHQPVTFTNLAGRVYENVDLERATLDGLIYSSTNNSIVGMIKYETLSTNFLASLNISANRIQMAEQRDAIRAEQKRQYDDAVRAQAAKEQQDALNQSNAVAQAQAPEAVNQASTGTKNNNGKPANHHRRKKKH